MAYLIFLKLQKFSFITLKRKDGAIQKASNLVSEVLYLGINDSDKSFSSSIKNE